jgi:TonB family protein
MRSKAPAFGWIALLLFSGLAQICAQTQSSPGADSSEKGTGDRIYRVGGGVSPPRAISSPDPEYSERARKEGYGGTCVLVLIVDPKGLPRDIRVTRALGLGLDEKAIEAVRSWTFHPAMKDGIPVAVRINVEVSFHLDNEDKLKKLFDKADAGDAKAQFEVSQVFLSGHDLFDESRGLPYLEKAAKQGLPKAQFAMGEYVSSRKNDLVTAYVWYALAQRHHYKNSDRRMNELAEKMTPEQLVEARRGAESNNPF